MKLFFDEVIVKASKINNKSIYTWEIVLVFCIAFQLRSKKVIGSSYFAFFYSFKFIGTSLVGTNRAKEGMCAFALTRTFINSTAGFFIFFYYYTNGFMDLRGNRISDIDVVTLALTFDRACHRLLSIKKGKR